MFFYFKNYLKNFDSAFLDFSAKNISILNKGVFVLLNRSIEFYDSCRLAYKTCRCISKNGTDLKLTYIFFFRRRGVGVVIGIHKI